MICPAAEIFTFSVHFHFYSVWIFFFCWTATAWQSKCAQNVNNGRHLSQDARLLICLWAKKHFRAAQHLLGPQLSFWNSLAGCLNCCAWIKKRMATPTHQPPKPWAFPGTSGPAQFSWIKCHTGRFTEQGGGGALRTGGQGARRAGQCRGR